jgi:peptide/nickel transport system permease protein
MYLVDSVLQGNGPVFVSALQHMILPVATLTFSYLAQVTRIARASMLEVLHQDYVRTARASGIHEARVIMKYAFRNASIPVLTMIGMIYGYLLGGTVLIELVFSWPGLGRYVVQAITRLDFPAIMGVTLVGATIVILLNLLVDLLCLLVNPVLRYQ